MIHDAVVHKITRRNPFLQDWPYYGVIDILNPVATAQYQHSATIPTKPGMAHDFRDLRFFQPDGTEIPFWNESKTDGSTSFNWIKPYSASQRKAYVFYGNREAVSQSSGEKVFEFFDHFLGSSLDSKWSYDNAPTVAVSNSVMSFQGKNAYVQVYSATTFGTNYALRAYAKMDSASDGQSIGFESSAADNCATWVRKSDGTWNLRTGVSSSYTNTAITTDTNWHTVEIRRNASTSVTLNIDGTSVTSTTNLPTTALATPDFNNWATGTYVYCDWVLVRKYTATEPTCQLNQSGLRNPAYR